MGKNVHWWESRIHPEDKPEILRKSDLLLQGLTSTYEAEHRFLHSSGEWKWIFSRGEVVERDNDGKPLRITGTVLDITNRKQAEQALKKSEEMYEDLYENAPDMYVSVDSKEGQILQCNLVLAKNLGYKKEEILGKSFFDFFHQDCIEEVKDAFELFKKTGEIKGVELQLKRRDGKEIDVSLSASAVLDSQGNILYSRSALRDISKQKRIEEALRESEKKYRLLFKSAPIGIGISNLKSQVLEANQKIIEITGYNLEELKAIDGKTTFFNLKDRELLINQLQKNRAVRDFEVKLKRKDGTIYDSLMDISLTKLGDQEVYLTIQRDLTELREIDKMKRESEERLRAFMDSATDSFSLFDSSLNFSDINKTGLDLLGLSKEELIGKNILDIFPEFKEIGWYDKCLEVIKTGQPKFLDDINSALKLGEDHYSIRAFKVNEGLGVITSNISNRVKAERTRKELEQRRDSFVWMTSHELRTPLTILTGYCDFLIEHKDDFSQIHPIKILTIMKNNLSRLERLTDGVSTFVQIQQDLFHINKTDINLIKFLQNAIEPYIHLLGEQFEFQGFPKDQLIIIEGDSSRLQQVVDNIIDNAMKQTNNKHRKILVTTELQLDRITIEISDNGVGINPKDLENIFEQFVSIPTKFSVTGTGMGLYIARKIIEVHEGSIRAESKGIGYGATFIIELPRKTTNK